MAARTWRCRSCLTAGQNPRARKCSLCGRKRPKKRQPKHMAAKLSYEEHESRNGGPKCGICKREPKPGKKHHRDHDHTRGGSPRGLLCFRCNVAVRTYMTLEWAVQLVFYLAKFSAPKDFDSPTTTKENHGKA